MEDAILVDKKDILVRIVLTNKKVNMDKEEDLKVLVIIVEKKDNLVKNAITSKKVKVAVTDKAIEKTL